MIQFEVIGTGYSDPVLTTNQRIVTPAQALPGWRVNATARVPGWEQWLTYDAPLRVFAGANTICYVFPDATTHATALAAYFEIAHTVKPVPAVVTMRQAQLALLSAGMLAGVEEAIEAMPEPIRSAARIEWQRASEVHRDASLVSGIKSQLGLTDDQIDQLFVFASGM